LKKVSTPTEQDLISTVDLGMMHRSTGSTKANQESSRSHAILQIYIEYGNTVTTATTTTSLSSSTSPQQHQSIGQFTLVDLAGSERGKDTGNTSRKARTEGSEINKSLLALKECIRALYQEGKEEEVSSGSTTTTISNSKTITGRNHNNPNRNHNRNQSINGNSSGNGHIPFRGSKLTQILKRSFTDKQSKTVMLCCIAPAETSSEHTLSTLRYAARVKGQGNTGEQTGVLQPFF